MKYLRTGLLILLIAGTAFGAPRNRSQRRTARLRPTRTTQRTYRPATPTYQTPQNQFRTTVSNYRVVSDVVVDSSRPQTTSEPVVVARAEISATDLTDESVGDVTQAVPSVTPMDDSNATPAADAGVSTATYEAPVVEATPVNSALAELNAQRAQRGLRALVEDPSLTVIARHKASIQANRGAMFHPGGSLGSARYEGVGVGARFIACYQYATGIVYAGAATVVGRNGQRYHCLLVR